MRQRIDIGDLVIPRMNTVVMSFCDTLNEIKGITVHSITNGVATGVIVDCTGPVKLSKTGFIDNIDTIKSELTVGIGDTVKFNCINFTVNKHSMKTSFLNFIKDDNLKVIVLNNINH